MHSPSSAPAVEHDWIPHRSVEGRQFVTEVMDGSRRTVVKVYGSKRSGYRTWIRQVGVRLGLGRSSIRAVDRFRCERRMLELWSQEGFDVPRILEIGTEQRPFLRLEYCSGPNLQDYLLDMAVPRPDKVRALQRFANALADRHRRARRIQDGRLIHGTPCLRNVLVCDQRLVFFDFESMNRALPVSWLIEKELVRFIESLIRVCQSWEPGLVEVFLHSYPDPDVLARLAGEWPRGAGPLRHAQELLAGWFGAPRRRRSRRQALRILRQHMAQHPGASATPSPW